MNQAEHKGQAQSCILDATEMGRRNNFPAATYYATMAVAHATMALIPDSVGEATPSDLPEDDKAECMVCGHLRLEHTLVRCWMLGCACKQGYDES